MKSQIKVPTLLFSIVFSTTRKEHIQTMILRGLYYLEENIGNYNEGDLNHFANWSKYLTQESSSTIQVDFNENTDKRINDCMKLMHQSGGFISINDNPRRKSKKETISELAVWGFESYRKEHLLPRPNTMTGFENWLNLTPNKFHELFSRVSEELETGHVSGIEYVSSVCNFIALFKNSNLFQMAVKLASEEVKDNGGYMTFGNHTFEMMEDGLAVKPKDIS